jgi:hypothetical protein
VANGTAARLGDDLLKVVSSETRIAPFLIAISAILMSRNWFSLSCSLSSFLLRLFLIIQFAETAQHFIEITASIIPASLIEAGAFDAKKEA